MSMLFDWDEENVSKIVEKHDVWPSEAEQAVTSRPIDLGYLIRNGEDRLMQIGETEAGRVLVVVTTFRKWADAGCDGLPSKP